MSYVPPAAKNLGSWGPAADGAYQSATTPMVAGPPYAGFGPNSYACDFNNTFNSYVNIPAPDRRGGPNLTVTAWIKRKGNGMLVGAWSIPTPTPPGWTNAADPRRTPRILDPPTGIGFNDYFAATTSWMGSIKATSGTAGDYGWTPTPSLAVPDQTWTFVAMVVDGANNMVLYMNDQSAHQQTCLWLPMISAPATP